MEFLLNWKFFLVLLIIIYFIAHIWIITNFNARRQRMKKTLKGLNQSTAAINRKLAEIAKDLES